ncbi:MAG TPA: hypothetical protein VJ768_02370 [Anaerolineales bacterium]|nr:hypothetical protein [Anaerolineales bacterium]
MATSLLRFAMSLIVLLVLSVACSPGEGTEPAPTPGGPSGEVLFEDDFSDPESGWDRVSNPSSSTDFLDGSYRIFVGQTNHDVWARPDLNFIDSVIEVEAQMVGGSDENDFGVICRYRDPGNFYFLVIGSDGFYGIGIMQDGEEPQLIGATEMQFSRRINQGGEPNLIRAECVGDVLSLYVNGKILDAVTDDRLPSGDVGLIAGTFDTPGTEILFDNFVVRNP